jgi:hypothetical protein
MLAEVVGEVTGDGWGEDDEGGDEEDAEDADGQGDGDGEEDDEGVVEVAYADACDVGEVFVCGEEGEGVEFPEEAGHDDDGDSDGHPDVGPGDGEDVTEEVFIEFGPAIALEAEEDDAAGDGAAEEDGHDGVVEELGPFAEPKHGNGNQRAIEEDGDGWLLETGEEAGGDTGKCGVGDGIAEECHAAGGDEHAEESADWAEGDGHEESPLHEGFGEEIHGASAFVEADGFLANIGGGVMVMVGGHMDAIGGLEGIGIEDFLWMALAADNAIEGKDPGSVAEDHGEVMGDEDDGDAETLVDGGDEFVEGVFAWGIDTGGGFIEEEEIWLTEETVGDEDSLELSAAEAGEGTIEDGFDIKIGEGAMEAGIDGLAALPEPMAGVGASESEEFADRECEGGFELESLGDVADAFEGFRANVLAEKADFAGVEALKAEEAA